MRILPDIALLNIHPTLSVLTNIFFLLSGIDHLHRRLDNHAMTNPFTGEECQQG